MINRRIPEHITIQGIRYRHYKKTPRKNPRRFYIMLNSYHSYILSVLMEAMITDDRIVTVGCVIGISDINEIHISTDIIHSG